MTITQTQTANLIMDKDFKQKWDKCLELIKDNIGAERFEVWFSDTTPESFKDDTIDLRVPSKYYVEIYEKDFIRLIRAALKHVFGRDIDVAYRYSVVNKDKKSDVSIEGTGHAKILNNKLVQSYENVPIERREKNFDSQLVSNLTFENYCVGDSNRLPVTIAEFIANNPGQAEFNPFFLYGNVGVGKTHLAQAIGIRIKEKNPNAKVLYVPLKQFQTLYANATMKKEIPAFINWFQQMDVLLFDDLQELAHKTGTAEALFPIFNHLQQNKKNLIFTCDRPPMELDGIADRLIDRFKWGVTERLSNPDYELRKKILSFKAKKNGLNLPEEVVDIIASTLNGSVREMEQIVMRMLTRSIVKNAPITVDLAQEAMVDVVKKPEKKVVNFDMIVETTAEHFNLSPDAIFSRSRLRDIADARQVIMYLTHKHTNLSSPAIGHKLNRKHATVLHGIGSIKDRLSYSKELSELITSIESELL